MEIDLFATYIWPNGGVSSQLYVSLPKMCLHNREIHKSPPKKDPFQYPYLPDMVHLDLPTCG